MSVFMQLDMPTLAQKIVDENAAGTSTALNFKGFAVGNPFTTVWSGMPASLETFWGHQIIAQPTWKEYNAECVNAKIPNVGFFWLLSPKQYFF
jgi:hypothetical protein